VSGIANELSACAPEIPSGLRTKSKLGRTNNHLIMSIRLDWKFLLTLLLTVASVVVPVWLWQADLGSKALLLTLMLVAELQPHGIGSLEGLQVVVDGKTVKSPFVSVLQLSNTGSRPILTADFEGPIKIQASKPSEILKAQVDEAAPSSLVAKAEVTGGVILLQPLLLNPGDRLAFTVVTANSRPEFVVSGRIAGVHEVLLKDAQGNKREIRRWSIYAFVVALLVVYMVNISEAALAAIRRKTLLPYSIATAFITGLSAGFLLGFIDPGEKQDLVNLLLVTLIACVISIVVVLARLRQQSAA
jgi:hypothetical protein